LGALASTTSVSGGAALIREDQETRAPQIAVAEPVEVLGFEPIARKRISSDAWEYISSGAGDEISLRWNREAFDRLRLMPRALIDVSSIDTHTRIFGRELPHPILLAPTAYHRLVHPEGELETARASKMVEGLLADEKFQAQFVAIESALLRLSPLPHIDTSWLNHPFRNKASRQTG
jgi:4-hydroxymandelate oxidase